MNTNDLSHLTQGPDEEAYGPCQDSECLLLFAICRICQFRRVIEFGGLFGYSARNFLEAMGPEGRVYSVEMNGMDTIDHRHIHVHKRAGDVTVDDFDREPVDLVFFDIHAQDEQMEALARLLEAGMVHSETVLALHDTGLHPAKIFDWAVPLNGGWCHQQVERRMVNILKGQGWEGVDFGCPNPRPPLKFRHGITLLKRRSYFEEPPPEWRQTVCMPGHLIDGPLERGLDSQGRPLP